MPDVTSTETAPSPPAVHATPDVPQDPRLSGEFKRRLRRYMGEYDPKSSFAPRYLEWYRSHLGERSDWFRNDMIWRLDTTRPIAGLRVLDFGCGTGSSSVVMGERGARVVGIETEQISIDIAIQRARDLGVTDRCSFVRIPYIEAGRAALPFKDSTFDVCTLIGVLEHMRHHERVDCAAEIRRVLAPDGEVFIFDTPNRAFPFDYHTTQLWFVGWMPVFLARQYAVLRRRFERRSDFGRYGATGITRRVIDRLFPAPAWKVTYEKKADEVAREFQWVGNRMSLVPSSLRDRAGRLLAKACRPLLSAGESLGFRAAWWTPIHTISLRRMPDGH